MRINELEEYLKEEKRNYEVGAERNAFLEGAYTIIQKLHLHSNLDGDVLGKQLIIAKNNDTEKKIAHATIKAILAVMNTQTSDEGKLLTINKLIGNYEQGTNT